MRDKYCILFQIHNRTIVFFLSMISILIMVAILISAAGSHIALYNIFPYTRKRAAQSITIIFVVFGCMLWVILHGLPYQTIPGNTWHTIAGTPLPITCSIIYIICSLMYIQYFAGVYSKDDSPTNKIYAFILKKKHVSYQQIRQIFSDQELILHRLGNLESMKLIRHSGTTYSVNKNGKFLSTILDMYRHMIGWRSSG
jgi:hypothetical protein